MIMSVYTYAYSFFVCSVLFACVCVIVLRGSVVLGVTLWLAVQEEFRQVEVLVAVW